MPPVAIARTKRTLFNQLRFGHSFASDAAVFNSEDKWKV